MLTDCFPSVGTILRHRVDTSGHWLELASFSLTRSTRLCDWVIPKRDCLLRICPQHKTPVVTKYQDNCNESNRNTWLKIWHRLKCVAKNANDKLKTKTKNKRVKIREQTCKHRINGPVYWCLSEEDYELRYLCWRFRAHMAVSMGLFINASARRTQCSWQMVCHCIAGRSCVNRRMAGVIK